MSGVDMVFAIVLMGVLSSSTPEPAPVSRGRAEVEAVLAAALPALQACNTDVVISPAVFELGIGDAGVVTSVVHTPDVDDGLRLPGIVPCLMARLQALTFVAKPAAQVRVQLQFSPNAGVRDVLVLAPSSTTPEVLLDPSMSSMSSSAAAAVAAHLGALNECYRDALVTSPTVAGTLVVRSIVGPDGALVDDTARPPLPDDILHVPLKACVHRVLRELRVEAATTSELTLALRFVRPRPPSLSAMHAALMAQAHALARCAQWKPQAAVAFTVDVNGAASDISAPDSVDVECARAVVAQARWPAPASGTVRVSAKAHVLGGLPRSEIQAVVTRDLWRIKHCYDVELNRDHLLQGTVIVQYVIGGDGTVLDVRTLRPTKPGAVELTNPRVVQCIVDVIRGQRYPRPKGGGPVCVIFPFVFAAPPFSSAPHSAQ